MVVTAAGGYEDGACRTLKLEGDIWDLGFGTTSVRVWCGLPAHKDTLVGKLEVSGAECMLVFPDDSKPSRFSGKLLCLHHVDFTWDSGCLYLVIKSCSTVLPIADDSECNILQAVETCGGIGALGIGLAAAGFKIAALNDKQEATLQAAGEAVQVPLILGDIADLKVVAAVHIAAPLAGTLAAGVSCQPFSRLGDAKAQFDERSASLPAALRASYLTGKRVIILECVTQAGSHSWVQSTLDRFCKDTGFSQAHTELELAEVWPARRRRWWCVLTHPKHSVTRVPPWQPHGSWRTVRDLIPDLKSMSSTADAQLYLSEAEIEVFTRFKPLHEYEVDPRRPLPTALHAWGSQLTACPCGCRLSGLSQGRLMKQGLHACLARDKGGAWRFLSGHEVAILNGMPPLDVHIDSRLHLALIGQLASPLQAGWVGATVLCSLHACGLCIPKPTDPILVLHAQRRMLVKIAEIQEWRPSTGPAVQAGHGVQAVALRVVTQRVTEHANVLGAEALLAAVGLRGPQSGPLPFLKPCWEAAMQALPAQPVAEVSLDSAACLFPSPSP